ncbi:MAG: alanine racemase [Halanaerobiales bacterium]
MIKMKTFTRPVWAEINLDNLRYNLAQIRRKLAGETEIMAVIKANAYGHGAIPLARTLVEEGVQRFGVAIPEEGLELREAGIKIPIHVLGEALRDQYSLLIDYDLTPTMAREETLEALNQLARERGIIKKIHIKIDTGMGRIGLEPEAGLSFLKKAAGLSNIEVEGLMTHFATADERDKSFSLQQGERFKRLIKELEEAGIRIPLKHAGNSASLIDLEEFQFNLVRPGLALYGLLPSAEVGRMELKPVLSWKARIDFLKEVPAGTPISYGATYRTTRKSKIATIPLGYADGYPRLLSNKGHVLIKGQQAPIRGRICMDQFMVDVTDIPGVEVGEEVVLIGSQGSESISATDLAALIGTINYEILTNISLRVPRKYISAGKGVI